MRRLRKATQIGFRERLETACPQAGLEIDRIEGDWLHATTAEKKSGGASRAMASGATAEHKLLRFVATVPPSDDQRFFAVSASECERLTERLGEDI